MVAVLQTSRFLVELQILKLSFPMWRQGPSKCRLWPTVGLFPPRRSIGEGGPSGLDRVGNTVWWTSGHRQIIDLMTNLPLQLQLGSASALPLSVEPEAIVRLLYFIAPWLRHCIILPCRRDTSTPIPAREGGSRKDWRGDGPGRLMGLQFP